LKQLEPGQFFARGPALAREPVLVRTGPVQTTHPQPGRVAPPVPPPPEAIRALLGQLRDLPTQAPSDLDDLEEARGRVAELARAASAPALQRASPVRSDCRALGAPAAHPGRAGGLRGGRS